MKIAICGDTHIGAVFGLGKTVGSINTRVQDYESSLNYIADFLVRENFKVFIQTGDLFDIRNPTPEHIEIINNVIKKLSDNGIVSFWLMGNHDYKKQSDGFTSSIINLKHKEYPNTRVFLSPELATLNFEGESVDFILVPYRDRRMYSGETTEEDSKLYELEVNDLLKKGNSKTKIVVGHNFFYEGSYSHYKGQEVLVNHNNLESCNLIVMGHYHDFKVVSKSSPIAFYIGSMERINFGDAGKKKYFLEYNSLTNSLKPHIIPVRELKELLINLEDVEMESIENELCTAVKNLQVEDAIIRLRITIKSNFANMVNIGRIQELLYENKAHFVSKVIVEPLYNKIIKDTEILNEKNNLKIFEAFLNKQPDEVEDDKKEILERISRIIKE